jgi:hypothetical protein
MELGNRLLRRGPVLLASNQLRSGGFRDVYRRKEPDRFRNRRDDRDDCE